jgi:hypothetical protein
MKPGNPGNPTPMKAFDQASTRFAIRRRRIGKWRRIKVCPMVRRCAFCSISIGKSEFMRQAARPVVEGAF